MTQPLTSNQKRVESQILFARNKILEFKWISPHEYTITVTAPDDEELSQ